MAQEYNNNLLRLISYNSNKPIDKFYQENFPTLYDFIIVNESLSKKNEIKY